MRREHEDDDEQKASGTLLERELLLLLTEFGSASRCASRGIRSLPGPGICKLISTTSCMSYFIIIIKGWRHSPLEVLLLFPPKGERRPRTNGHATAHGSEIHIFVCCTENVGSRVPGSSIHLLSPLSEQWICTEVEQFNIFQDSMGVVVSLRVIVPAVFRQIAGPNKYVDLSSVCS